jgi:hypothetical protein
VQNISRVKGTQDLFDLTLYNFMLSEFEKHAQLYRFHQIETPIIERVELFKRSLGLHTDVVSKEMFIIESKNQEDAICLRPEATAPTLRAFLELKPLTPWKVYSIGALGHGAGLFYRVTGYEPALELSRGLARWGLKRIFTHENGRSISSTTIMGCIP